MRNARRCLTRFPERPDLSTLLHTAGCSSHPRSESGYYSVPKTFQYHSSEACAQSSVANGLKSNLFGPEAVLGGVPRVLEGALEHLGYPRTPTRPRQVPHCGAGRARGAAPPRILALRGRADPAVHGRAPAALDDGPSGQRPAASPGTVLLLNAFLEVATQFPSSNFSIGRSTVAPRQINSVFCSWMSAYARKLS